MSRRTGSAGRAASDAADVERCAGVPRRPRLVGVAFSVAIVLGALTGVPLPAEAGPQQRPCDIYGAAGTPCVAAYSTTRALYAGYDGPLYQVRRSSDGTSRDIGLTAPGGYADAGAQDRFCANTTCEITLLVDQSPGHNDLPVEGPGGNGGQNVGVVANKLPVTVAGHNVYGMYFEGGMGYRDNQTTGVATGAEPESMYMVTSGSHFNSLCCFDFGNAEINGHDTGNGHMDAIYFGSMCQLEWRTCPGSGPWVEADLENGLFMSGIGLRTDLSYTGNTDPFVTAMLKNNGINTFAIKDADAQSGPLATHWSGPLPWSPLDTNPPSFTIPSANNPSQTEVVNPPLVGYRPMKKEGAILLGTGGDDSNSGVGSFFEGAMTTGYTTNPTDDAVQANVVSAAYSSPPVTGAARHS